MLCSQIGAPKEANEENMNTNELIEIPKSSANFWEDVEYISSYQRENTEQHI